MLGLILSALLSLSADTLYIFYSPSCPHCKETITALGKHPPKMPFKLLNMEEDSIINILDSLETSLGVHKDEIPVFYYSGKLYYGSLPGILPELSYKSSPPVISECRTCKPSEAKIHKEGVPVAIYVYTPGCRKCSRFSVKLQKIKKRLNISVMEVSSFDSLGLAIINTLKNKKLYKKTPLLLVGDTVIYDLPDSLQIMAQIVKKHAGKGLFTSFRITRENLKLTLGATIVAALIDGINPCAFTVLLFLIAFLSYRKKSRKESLFILMFFSFGIFIAYFSIGMGLFWLLDFINRITILRTVMRIAIGLFAITLGIFSLKDGIMIIKGKSSTNMGLSLNEKQKTHFIIRKYIDKGLLAGSLFMGLSISFVEFACTGQIYLPTISYISRHEGLTVTKLLLLLLYNLFFLIPLIIIGLFAIFMEHRVVSRTLRNDTPYIKFATAILFFGLGILVMFF